MIRDIPHMRCDEIGKGTIQRPLMISRRRGYQCVLNDAHRHGNMRLWSRKMRRVNRYQEQAQDDADQQPHPG